MSLIKSADVFCLGLTPSGGRSSFTSVTGDGPATAVQAEACLCSCMAGAHGRVCQIESRISPKGSGSKE